MSYIYERCMYELVDYERACLNWVSCISKLDSNQISNINGLKSLDEKNVKLTTETFERNLKNDFFFTISFKFGSNVLTEIINCKNPTGKSVDQIIMHWYYFDSGTIYHTYKI